ncbi:putative peptidase A1 family protein [Lyophyllum shimeji]|uniref:Peptidase A1 family protein n=1 Tax=Lyophyllum shimeji TaxID=47721 RepID=A0A9P3PUW4_LYOSH|nr:putative peptidase A1 family protein [Lyophyllum shimeji]
MGDWAKAHREWLTAKYSGDEARKRSVGTNLISDQNQDSSYFGSLAIGTPPVSYNVILDTGSADLWLADSNCSSCNGVATFNPNSSSSFSSSGSPFSISYGSGQATGYAGSDTVQMAGFKVTNQTFGLADQVSSGLLNNPVSGLLGLAFKQIAASGATPFWQALVEGGAWDQPLMAFHLTRHVGDPSSQNLEYGGSLTMGGTNNSLYTGDIEWHNLATNPSFWVLSLTSLTTQGNAVSIPGGREAYSAIDTGTTLVGGPSDVIHEFYSKIPGSSPGSGSFDGYYTYPCNQHVNATMSFGGKNWPISESDFKLTQLTPSTCLGAFFVLSTGRSAPTWIVGDTFLKNVYSLFRYNPPSVGFAQLSDTAQSLNNANIPAPSPTIGSVAASVAATSLPSSMAADAASETRTHSLLVLFVTAWTLSLLGGSLL